MPTEDGDPEDSESPRDRCDYCRLPCPKPEVNAEIDGDVYGFCSEGCRDALVDSDRVFTEYHGFRRVRTGVSALDASLPQGIPRNSFIMLKDLAGTRTEAIQAELVWRALQRGEPAVFMSFLEPPVSLIQEFVTLDWNVLPYLESGQLRIIDCFTYRVDDRERMFDRMNAWNSHLSGFTEEATTRVRDPSETSELGSRLDSALEDLDMHDTGVVVVDSLTELGSLVQPIQAYQFVKDVRADVCKGRFVPIFAGATVSGEGDTFPHDLDYMVDGLIELRLNEDIVENALIKQLRIRKMSGVLTYPEWSVYEYTSGTGIVTFDPSEEMEGEGDETDAEAQAEAEAADAGGEREGDGETEVAGGNSGADDGAETAEVSGEDADDREGGSADDDEGTGGDGES